ncbi:hypothetical protein DFQ28_005717 [Apophysomyces sp. BC1034]|nr:hypothetical protein DFQ30_005700 [Apophysomyces sp. BC1015]KAG0177502.1 hypothetical protein DFQ29_004755 [Apophysomyces sp. BC1021]KAG0187883.1 hypothetical protein DFQ28_005717 [Apophysomyces sp. BC1034]
MPVDLPLYKPEPGVGSKRPRSNKRLIFGLALVGAFLLFYLNIRVSSPQISITQETTIVSPGTSPTPHSNVDEPSKDTTSLHNSFLEDEDDNEDAIDPPLTVDQDEQTEAMPDKSEIRINNSKHYTYLVVIGSPAQYMSRRRLIRDKYFGLKDNLLPCMQHDTDVYYKFWIHGGPPASDTPTRREYEAEKMEWNDLVQMPPKTQFNQLNIIQWADDLFKEEGITYEYLIVQDIHTFVRLSTLRHELDAGVIGENTESPETLSTEAPLNLVWGTFSGQPIDQSAFVVGSTAAKLALKKQTEIQIGSSKALLTNMYNYFLKHDNSLEKAVESMLPEAAAEIKEKVVPMFVAEDRETHRFVRWENNIESISSKNNVVTHVYQDSEFAELAAWTSIEPVLVCHPRRQNPPPPMDPLDDDETVTAPVSNKVAIRTQSTAIVTSSFIYDACMEPSATMAAMNKRDYALRHGYSFVARSAEFAQQAIRKDRKTVWGKIDVIEKVLPKYEWILWMDMDAVILNQDRTLEALFEELQERYPDGKEAFDRDVDLIVARPSGDPMINAGVFLMRYSPWSMQFLRDLQGIVEWYNKGSSYEQGAMWDLLRKPENLKRTFLLDKDNHTFNTFPSRYKAGDFIVHFAPDKCPNDATLSGLRAADKIKKGETVTAADLK